MCSQFKAMQSNVTLMCEHDWSPHIKKETAEWGEVQKRATERIKGVEGLPCEERWQCWGLCSLEKRQIRGEMRRDLYNDTWCRENGQREAFLPLIITVLGISSLWKKAAGKHFITEGGMS